MRPLKELQEAIEAGGSVRINGEVVTDAGRLKEVYGAAGDTDSGDETGATDAANTGGDTGETGGETDTGDAGPRRRR